jgi:hypothetical protein
MIRAEDSRFINPAEFASKVVSEMVRVLFFGHKRRSKIMRRSVPIVATLTGTSLRIAGGSSGKSS